MKLRDKFVAKLNLFLFYLRNRDVNKLRFTYRSGNICIQVVNAFGYSNLLILPIK